MEQKEYISSVIYEGLLYGSGLAVIPFLLDDLRSDPQGTHYGYMASLASLGGAYHWGAFVGKFFSYGFKNCLSYYNTHFVDFFCLLALLIFGFSANITWLFIGRIGVGFMAGIQGKTSSVSALLFTDYASYELSVAISTALFSILYWSSVDNSLPDSKHDIPAAQYFTDHPAALGTLACNVLIFLSYIVYFIRKRYLDEDRQGYVAISEHGMDRSINSRLSRSYHEGDHDPSDMSASSALLGNSESDLSMAEKYSNVPNRYLRGCKMDATEARRRWHLTLDWRIEEDVDGILEESQPNFFKIKECYPHYFHNWSRDGHPVYYERVGYVDKKKMKEYGITVPMLLRHYVFITEYLWRKLDPDEDAGASISIMDVENVGLRDLMGDTLEFLSMSSKIIQGHYVERCHKIFVINAPFLFNAVWRAVQPMVHENTRKKIFILGSSRKELFDCIDPSQVPVAYGGTGEPLGNSKEEEDLAAFVKRINEVEQKEPFSSARKTNKVPIPSAESSSQGTSPAVSAASSLNKSNTETSAQSAPRDRGGFMNYFSSTISSVVSTIKNNASNVIGRPDSNEAFLGTKNEYVYDENTNAWVLHSSDPAPSTPNDSPIFDPRESRGGVSMSRETSSSSVQAPLLGRENQSAKAESRRQELKRGHLTPSVISTLLSRHRQEKGPQVWEFTTLCVVLLVFQATLVFVLELIPVWLYLPSTHGGWNYSVANVGLIISVSALIAATGLYLAGYPKHIVYTPVCTRMSTESGTEIATVELQGQDRFRESRAMSTSPYPSHRLSTVGRSTLASPSGGVSNVSLQSLFWLGMVSELFALFCAAMLLPFYFHDVPAWPTTKNFIFHVVLCGIVSSTIFSLAAVYECFIVTKKASVLTGSQDMKLTFFISIATMLGSFMGPVALYLLNVQYGNSPAAVGTHAFIIAEVIVFLLCAFCYLKPPKYPLYVYS